MKGFFIIGKYYYKISHFPFLFPFFLAINPFSCILIILVFIVLNDLPIVFAICSCLIVGFSLIIFKITCSSKVQFLHLFSELVALLAIDKN